MTAARALSAALFLVGIAVAPAPAAAQPLIAAPGDPAYDAALADRIAAYSRVQDFVTSLPVGFGLEAQVADPADRALIESFVASGSTDFAATTGRHPYEVVDGFGEQGDLGMFGGVQAAGLAWRYVVLRDRGGSAQEVGAARDAPCAPRRGCTGARR